MASPLQSIPSLMDTKKEKITLREAAQRHANIKGLGSVSLHDQVEEVITTNLKRYGRRVTRMDKWKEAAMRKVSPQVEKTQTGFRLKKIDGQYVFRPGESIDTLQEWIRKIETTEIEIETALADFALLDKGIEKPRPTLLDACLFMFKNQPEDKEDGCDIPEFDELAEFMPDDDESSDDESSDDEEPKKAKKK